MQTNTINLTPLQQKCAAMESKFHILAKKVYHRDPKQAERYFNVAKDMRKKIEELEHEKV